MIKYRGFIGHFSFDDKHNLFIGRVANSHDLITFQGKSISEIREAFNDAINEHIDWCKKHGKLSERLPLKE
jgi:predicted HicB family RNase H-like nuclease